MSNTIIVNNPSTGIIDRGPQGITFAGVSLMRGKYAFAPTTRQFGTGGNDTKWFGTYEEAKAAFDAAAPYDAPFIVAGNVEAAV